MTAASWATFMCTRYREARRCQPESRSSRHFPANALRAKSKDGVCGGTLTGRACRTRFARNIESRIPRMTRTRKQQQGGGGWSRSAPVMMVAAFLAFGAAQPARAADPENMADRTQKLIIRNHTRCWPMRRSRREARRGAFRQLCRASRTTTNC